jgi:DNA-binding MarR family transcriptional regulator
MAHQGVTTIDQARYIFTTGKLIHDHILKIQSRYLASCAAGPMSDLSVAQLHAIRIVRSCGELTMRELAELMEVSPPSASVMVDRLVEKGALQREHSTVDRRKVVVSISPDAVKKAEAIEDSILQLFVNLVEAIGFENAQKWCDVLASVKAALSQNSGPGALDGYGRFNAH